MLTLIIVTLWIALLARWVVDSSARRSRLPADPAHTAELARLREEVDQLTAQVLRLQEEQSFTMRLLAEGGAARTAPPLPEGEPDLTINAEKP